MNCSARGRRHRVGWCRALNPAQTADSAPGVATWEATLSARKVVSCVRLTACNWYYSAQIIAKPKAACAPRFSWAATSSNLSLRGNMTSSVKPEVDKYHSAARAGLSHGNRWHVQKIGRRSDVHFQRFARGQTNTHTDRHAGSLQLCSS